MVDWAQYMQWIHWYLPASIATSAPILKRNLGSKSNRLRTTGNALEKNLVKKPACDSKKVVCWLTIAQCMQQQELVICAYLEQSILEQDALTQTPLCSGCEKLLRQCYAFPLCHGFSLPVDMAKSGTRHSLQTFKTLSWSAQTSAVLKSRSSSLSPSSLPPPSPPPPPELPFPPKSPAPPLPEPSVLGSCRSDSCSFALHVKLA